MPELGHCPSSSAPPRGPHPGALPGPGSSFRLPGPFLSRPFPQAPPTPLPAPSPAGSSLTPPTRLPGPRQSPTSPEDQGAEKCLTRAPPLFSSGPRLSPGTFPTQFRPRTRDEEASVARHGSPFSSSHQPGLTQRRRPRPPRYSSAGALVGPAPASGPRPSPEPVAEAAVGP